VRLVLGNGRWEGMLPRTERMLPCCVERCVRFAWRNKGGGELCRSAHAVPSVDCDEKYEHKREFKKTHKVTVKGGTENVTEVQVSIQDELN